MVYKNKNGQGHNKQDSLTVTCKYCSAIKAVQLGNDSVRTVTKLELPVCGTTCLLYCAGRRAGRPSSLFIQNT